MSRYVIVGAGAVGVTLAAELRRADRDVVLVARGAQLERLRSGGFRYVRPGGVEQLDLPVVGGPAELELRADDVLVLATKTQQAEAALAEWAARPVGDDAGPTAGRTAGEVLPVVTVQNGLDVERIALRRFATVLGAVLWTPATYEQDGEVFSPAAPAAAVAWLGTYPDGPATPVVAAVAADLAAADLEVQVVDDLSRWKAGKLVGSVTFVLDALYPAGPERDRAAALLQTEAAHVLTAAGLDPADLRAEGTQDFTRFTVHPIEGYARRGNSTFQSLTRARSVETDFLNGEIVLLARLTGVTAAANARLQARIVRALRDGVDPGGLPLGDLTATLAGLDEPGTVGAGR